MAVIVVDSGQQEVSNVELLVDGSKFVVNLMRGYIAFSGYYGRFYDANGNLLTEQPLGIATGSTKTEGDTIVLTCSFTLTKDAEITRFKISRFGTIYVDLIDSNTLAAPIEVGAGRSVAFEQRITIHQDDIDEVDYGG